MSKPFFSVITPQHNSAEFMRAGLNSIQMQNFEDYELIIVCDACTDNTEEIAKGYLREGRDRMLVTDFGRAGMARNAALDIATGKWILFMDDDDFWMRRDAFETIARELWNVNDVDVLAFAFYWRGRAIAVQKESKLYTAVWNKAWRRKFIGDTRFPDWVHTDDLGFDREMKAKAKEMYGGLRIKFCESCLYHYNFMRLGSVSDRIRKGEFNNGQLPEDVRGAAEGYERWLRTL